MKDFDIQPLLRPHILHLRPYSSARDEYSGKVGIFLDANENPLGSVAEGAHNRYPDPLQKAVKAEIARQKGLSPQQIFLGNGSDEAIDLLIRAFCEPRQDELLIMPPTYGMYRVCADINDVPVKSVPLTPDFQMDLQAVGQALHARSKLVFVCSPNNPTGNLLRREAVLQLLEGVPGLLVVDEAYIDFAPGKSLLPLLKDFPRLVVLQTFSKAWGMANLRLGMAFAHVEVIDVLNKIKPPYNVNGLSQELALRALQQAEKKAQMVAEILRQRTWLREQLEKLPLVQRVYPSDANFLLVKTPDPNGLYRKLIDRRLIVRNRSSVQLCEGCLRITVGSEEENRQLLHALKELSE